MELFDRIFSAQYLIQWIEVITIAAILVVLIYIFHSLNIFSK